MNATALPDPRHSGSGLTEADPSQPDPAAFVPETTMVDTRHVWCDGSGDIRSGPNFRPASLGHPRVFMQIDEKGYVDCGYCDRRFILERGPADPAAAGTGERTRGPNEVQPGDLPLTGDGGTG